FGHRDLAARTAHRCRRRSGRRAVPARRCRRHRHRQRHHHGRGPVTAPATGRKVWSGLATGIGSWPGTDPREAAAVVVGELTDLPHLVELPARGLGADMIGRVSALLVDMYLDTSTTGYRLVSRRGGVAARARDLLAQDLDALDEAWERAGLRSEERRVGQGGGTRASPARESD